MLAAAGHLVFVFMETFAWFKYDSAHRLMRYGIQNSYCANQLNRMFCLLVRPSYARAAHLRAEELRGGLLGHANGLES